MATQQELIQQTQAKYGTAITDSAINYINAALKGKVYYNFYGGRDLINYHKAINLLKSDPNIGKAIEDMYNARQEAKRSGFGDNVQEYAQAQQWGIHQIEKAPIKQELAKSQMQQALDKGDIIGFSGQLLTDTEKAKANLLQAIENSIKQQSIKPPEQYGEYLKATTPQGMTVLQEYKKTLPFKEQLTPTYYVSPEDEFKLKAAKIGLESGQVSGINIGTPVTLNNFASSYWKNVQTSSNAAALNMALIGSGGILYKAGKPLIKNIIPLTEKALSTRGGQMFVTGLLTSPLIVPEMQKIQESIYQPKTIKGRFGKALVEGAIITSSPFLAGAYAVPFATSLITNPYGTAESMIVNYPETAGFIFGSGLKVKAKLPKMEIGKIDKAPQSMSFTKDIGGQLKGYTPGEFKITYDIPFKKEMDIIWTQTINRIDKTYKPVETSLIGEKAIIGAEGTKGSFDIGLIPERGAKLEITPELVSKKDVYPKEDPIVKAQNDFQREVLAAVKKNEDIIGGSYAGKILFEGTRKPGDIDIISKNPIKTAKMIQDSIQRELLTSQINDIKLIKERTGLIKVNPHKVKGINVVAVEDMFGNKADIVGIEGYKGERTLFGFGKLKTKKVGEFNVLNPEILLKKKLQIIKELGLYDKKSAKAIKDIEAYTKGQLNLDVERATIKGAYGNTPKQLEAYKGKKGNIAHSSTGLFSVFNKKFFEELNKSTEQKMGKFFNIFQDKIKLEQAKESGGFDVLFGTPFDIKTGMTQTRVTRLGMRATWKDLFKGNVDYNKPIGKSQIIIFENQKIGKKINPQYGKEFSVLKKSSELEVGLPVEQAKGSPNIIRKKGSAGTTLINGNRVEINLAEIVEANKVLSKETLKLIDKAKENKLSNNEIRKLNENLYKETGIDYSLGDKPYFDVQRIYQKSIKLAQQSIEKSMASMIKRNETNTRRNLSSEGSKSTTPSSGSVLSKSDISSYNQISRDISRMSMSSRPSIPSKPSQPSRPSEPSQPSRPSIPSIPYIPVVPKISVPYNQREKPKPRKASLGLGYNVYGKVLKSSKFFKINTYPLTKSRALDIGTYYVDQTLAKTFKIKQEGQAQEDMEFAYIPYGYHVRRGQILREYKIKNRQPYAQGEQFIEKARFGLDTASERRQIKAFQKQVSQVMNF